MCRTCAMLTTASSRNAAPSTSRVTGSHRPVVRTSESSSVQNHAPASDGRSTPHVSRIGIAVRRKNSDRGGCAAVAGAGRAALRSAARPDESSGTAIMSLSSSTISIDESGGPEVSLLIEDDEGPLDSVGDSGRTRLGPGCGCGCGRRGIALSGADGAAGDAAGDGIGFGSFEDRAGAADWAGAGAAEGFGGERF